MKRLSAVLALTALGACATYNRVLPPEVKPRTELRLQFPQPRTLTLHSLSGDTMYVGEVTEVQGTMISLTSDSLLLGVSSVQLRPAGRQRFGAGTTTMLAVGNAKVDAITANHGRTVLLVAALIGGLAILIATVTYQDPPPPPPPEPKPKA